MNIPADIPSPDQENVYYSIQSLVGELVNYFDSDSISKVTDAVKEFYLPVFVFDDTNAPNSYQLDVYPRGGKKVNILLDSTGTVLINSTSAIAAIPLTNDDELKDGGLKTTIDSSFYSNSKLKSQDTFTDLEYDDESNTGLEMLLASKFWMNNDVKQTIMSRNQYIELIKSIVKSAFASLPEEEIEIIKGIYKAKQEDINQIVNIINELQIGQAETLDSLKFNSLVEKVHYEEPEESTDGINPNTTAGEVNFIAGYPSLINEQFGLKLTRANVAQSLLQLNNSRDGITKKWIEASIQHKNEGGPIFIKPPAVADRTCNYTKVWNSFIQRCIDKSYIEDTKIESLVSGQISGAGDELNSILAFTNQGVNKDTFIEKDGNSSWISEWYFNNFEKVLTGKETDFSSLESFLEEYQSLLDKVETTAKLNVLGGGFVLVHQAILKSLLKLCQSNVDVSAYAPMVGTASIFTLMGRSALLGPSACHQSPSKYSQSEDEYNIVPFSKTGFLCYQAIIKIISRISNSDASNSFIKSNVSSFDSGHAQVLKLWEDLGQKNITEEDKKVAHLWAINEEFSGNDIWLIPSGDYYVKKSERSFINYNHPDTSVMTEQGMNIYDFGQQGLKPLAEDSSAFVSSNGTLNLENIPLSYQRMGYRSDGNHKISSNRHYGITNPELWSSDDYGAYDSLESLNVFEFFKQRNYNLPYFWASTVSIYKAIVVETYQELISSINDILGTTIELTHDEISSTEIDGFVFAAIENTINSLKKMNGFDAVSMVRRDGSITFTDWITAENNSARTGKVEYKNTAGDNTATLVKNYIKFTSLVSEHPSIQLVEEHKPVSYDYPTFVPIEVLATSANPNYQNAHGGLGAYISDSFEEYYDPLEFRNLEYIGGSIIKKNTTALGVENSFNDFYSAFVSQTKVMYQHVLFNKEIILAFEAFKAFIDGFSIPESAIHIFSAGNIDIKNDIKNPQRLIDQIISNKELYSADAQGISQKWNKIAIEDVESFASSSSNWLYVYVVGIDSNEFVNGEVKIVPTYIGSSGVEIELTSTKNYWTFNINKTLGTQANPLNSDELESELALNYLHLVRGIDLSETAFSYKTDRVYEEHIINSGPGVFPWDADSFKEGIPKETIDPIFNMSPWVYPTNYFYDVCVSNEFKRVVACVIKEEHISGLEVDSVSVGSIQEIIGSIRWKIKEE